jgi:hypothetical protein
VIRKEYSRGYLTASHIHLLMAPKGNGDSSASRRDLNAKGAGYDGSNHPNGLTKSASSRASIAGGWLLPGTR